MSTVDAVVVGGGIGGLAAALALARTGHQVRVLERAHQFGEVGAGLQMAPNATRVLRRWGVLDHVIQQGYLPRRVVLRDALDGRELTYLDLTDAGRRYGAPYVVIHRSDLQDILLAACRAAGVDLVTDACVVRAEVADDHAVAISAKRRDTGRVLLAADGLGSGLRARLSGDQPVSSAFVAYRGALPLTNMPSTDHLALEDVVLYIGPGLHLVQYPLRRGEIFNQVAAFRSPRALAGEPEWGTFEELEAAFTPACAPVRAALPHLWRDRCWRMADREPIGRWVDRRLALIGDAAHPMLQYLAQGACQALEDADVLANQVAARTRVQRTDWHAALTRYASLRIPRTALVQRTARQWGEVLHCDGVFRSVRNALLSERSPTDYRYIDWLYGVDGPGLGEQAPARRSA